MPSKVSKQALRVEIAAERFMRALESQGSMKEPEGFGQNEMQKWNELMRSRRSQSEQGGQRQKRVAGQ